MTWVLFSAAAIASYVAITESVGFLWEHIGELPQATLYTAAVLSPIPVFFVGGGFVWRGLTGEINRALGVEVNWRRFAFVFVGVPLPIMLIATDVNDWGAAFSVLARVNATLFIAVVLDARGGLHLLRRDPQRGRRLGAMFGLLCLFGFGTLMAVIGTFTAFSEPAPEGVSYDAANFLAFCWAAAACVAAITLLSASAAERIIALDRSMFDPDSKLGLANTRDEPAAQRLPVGNDVESAADDGRSDHAPKQKRLRRRTRATDAGAGASDDLSLRCDSRAKGHLAACSPQCR